MNERDALCALNAISGLGNRGIKKLINYFGSARRILTADRAALRAARCVSDTVTQKIDSFDIDAFLREETERVAHNGITLITHDDVQYPPALKEIPDAPVILYCKGRIPPYDSPAIAIVGARRASFYGISTAEKLASGLAELGVVIVSGLARGIDAAAHRGALKVRGLTVAVLGSGLSRIYPAEHKKLFDEIAGSGGAVISEFPMTMGPLAYNFPRRNRIISGLSVGIVVVEASHRSGALITSDYALEQGRDVFAVPGKIDSPTAQGVNALIKQGAKLISGIDDIIEELAPRLAALRPRPCAHPCIQQETISTKGLSEEELGVYNTLTANPLHIDELGVRLKAPTGRLGSVLLALELKKLAKQLPGKLFVKAH